MQIELEQINLEDYELDATYCRKYLPKGGVCISFIKNAVTQIL
jgi:hypothetical protein